MARPQVKDDVVIEEEGGVFERTIEQFPPSTTVKRPRDGPFAVESPSKFQHTTGGTRSAAATQQGSLSVPFWKKLNHRHPAFQTREVGHFSLLNRDDDKECFDDKRYLRVFTYPLQTLNVNFDLKVGQTDFASDGQSKNINAMLWWALRNKQEIFKNDQFNFDFLSWRGVLRLIMFSLFEKHSDWLLAVVKFKNAYFLCEYTTEGQMKEEQNMTAEHRAFCYYGHKFEEYVTHAAANLTTEALNPSKQFTGVFRASIDTCRLVYGAEMDCVVQKSPSIAEHIELKVCAGKSLNDLPFRHNRKFAKWWIQSFLVGINTMVIGLRDNDGIVNALSPLNIAHLERSAETWSGASFFNFFLMFASFVKEHVTDAYALDHKDVMLFRFLPSAQRITVERSSDAQYHFIPDWFANGFL